MRVDTHQHLWTQPLIEALSARSALPLIRHTDGLTVLHCAGEQPYVIGPATPELAEGLDQALIAISSPIGIEALARESALQLITAHLDGVDQLGSGFAAWGPVPLDGISADDVDAVLERGSIGVSLPAGALAGPDWLERVGPLLERAAARGAVVFVHPGRAPGQRVQEASLGEPLWWPALSDYVSQMQAAWLTFATCGRRAHPELVVLFAMLAGGAPLLAERLQTRGGPHIDLRDPLSFYETSSFGAVATEALARQVGISQIVYGSDRPVLEPIATKRDVWLQTNAAKLLSPVGALA